MTLGDAWKEQALKTNFPRVEQHTILVKGQPMRVCLVNDSRCVWLTFPERLDSALKQPYLEGRHWYDRLLDLVPHEKALEGPFQRSLSKQGYWMQLQWP